MQQLVHTIDPLLLIAGVRDELLGLEPECDLVLGRLRAIAPVDDVSSNNNSKVSPDGSWLRFLWVRGTNQLPTVLDNTFSFPDHGKHGTGAEEVTQSTEERSFLQIMVVLLGELLGWNHQLDGNKLVSFSLKSGHYLRNEASLDAVGLDGDEGALHLGGMHVLTLEHVGCGWDGCDPCVAVGGCGLGVVGVGVCGGEGGGPGEVAEGGERGVPPVCGEDGGGGARGGGGGGGEEGPGGLAGGVEELGGGGARHGGGGETRLPCVQQRERERERGWSKWMGGGYVARNWLFSVAQIRSDHKALCFASDQIGSESDASPPLFYIQIQSSFLNFIGFIQETTLSRAPS